MKSISSFNCCKNMFTLINIWMIGKKHYLKKKRKDFYSNFNMEDIRGLS